MPSSYRELKSIRQRTEFAQQLHYGDCTGVGVPKDKTYIVRDKKTGKLVAQGVSLTDFAISYGRAARGYTLIEQ
jgi:hypothetical protein